MNLNVCRWNCDEASCPEDINTFVQHTYSSIAQSYQLIGKLKIRIQAVKGTGIVRELPLNYSTLLYIFLCVHEYIQE